MVARIATRPPPRLCQANRSHESTAVRLAMSDCAPPASAVTIRPLATARSPTIGTDGSTPDDAQRIPLTDNPYCGQVAPFQGA